MREPSDPAIREAPVAAPLAIGIRQHRRGLIVAMVAALLMTIVGTFGTGDVPLGRRLGYWVIIMGAGAMLGMGASAGVRTWGRLAARPVLEGACITLLISAPLTLVALGTTSLFFDIRPGRRCWRRRSRGWPSLPASSGRSTT